MRTHSWVSLGVLGLVAAACSSTPTVETADVSKPLTTSSAAPATSSPDTSASTGTPSTETSSVQTIATTTTSEPTQDPLPDECLGLDTPILPTQLTYVADGKLIALDLTGTPACLLDLDEDAGVGIAAWGAQGDRVMFDNGRVDVLGGDGRPSGEVGSDNLIFSWPTGFNMIWLEDGVIMKSTTDARQTRDLDVGAPVSEVLYHPDGQHLFVVTNDPEFGAQVLVTNSEGEEGVTLLFAEDGRISELAVSADGDTIVFSAEHDNGAIHVHSFDIEAAVVEIPTDGDETERVLEPSDEIFVMTIYESTTDINNIVFDASGDQVAFAVGDCSTGFSIELIDLVAGGYPLPVDPLFSASPVGFVSETQLAILVYDDTCTGGDLFVADTITGDSELIRAGVDDAAIRRIEQAARFTLVDLAILGFA